MSNHAAPRRRSLWRTLKLTPTRAVLSLGIVLGFGAVSTSAYWTDQATVTGGGFTAGTLNLKVDSVEGNPTPYAWTTFKLDSMIPTESFAGSILIQNTGTTPFTYTAMAAGSGDLLPHLRFEAFVGGDPTNSTVSGLRTGSCSGSSMGVKTLTATNQSVIATAQQVAATIGTQKVCVVATLVESAPNEMQTKTASATYVFNAKQLGAP